MRRAAEPDRGEAPDISTTAPGSTWKSRMLSTTHPHVLYKVAAAEVVFFVALGAVLMSRSIVGGCLVAAIGSVAGLLPAAAAHWSERHPDQARQRVATLRAARGIGLILGLGIGVVLAYRARYARATHGGAAPSV